MDNGAILYAQYLNGDDNALNQLVEIYSDGLVRFAYCFVKDSATAEDIAEETFAALIFKRRRFSPNASFKTYLYKIARNKCLDCLRFRRKFVPLDDLQNVLPFENGYDVETLERYETLYRCMQDLDPQYRNVLMLKYIEGFDVSDVAEITGKNVKQIYNLLARAKSALKQIFESKGIYYEDI